jgi:hypothetical protein
VKSRILDSVDSVRDEAVDSGTLGKESVEGVEELMLEVEGTELDSVEDVKCNDEGVGTLVEDLILGSMGEGVDEIEGTDGGKGMS